MSQVSNLDVPLDELVQAQDMRGRGGGRMRGGKRYSPRRDESSPYARRGGRMGSRPFRGGGGGGGFSTNGAAPVSAGPSNRVYVGNLPWQTSWQDLKDHMRQAGNVVRADVFVDETGRSKGCGIVEYSTPEEAQNAIKTLNDTKLDETERLIFVREDREERTFVSGPRRPPVRGRGAFGGYPGAGAVGRGGGGTFAPPPIPSTRGRQVFVGNLPYTTSWQDLKDQFRLAGNVIRADILLDTTGRSKGQGTVLFESPQDAQKAIRMFENTDFQTRIISVHEDKFAQ
jgi:hypothetical protein